MISLQNGIRFQVLYSKLGVVLTILLLLVCDKLEEIVCYIYFRLSVKSDCRSVLKCQHQTTEGDILSTIINMAQSP